MATDPSVSISEIFFSIQGESTYSGLPCFFIRLSGCNLRCSFCDARYTYEEPGEKFLVSELLEQANGYPGAIVEITGGEPLLQVGVYPLMEGLLAADRTVLLETNGSISLASVPARVIKIMDLKCPGSGMHDRMDLANFNYLTDNDEVKFVIGSRQDYDWAVRLIEEYDLADRIKPLFSPNTETMAATDLAALILADNLPVRLQLQLHKTLWPDMSRGR